MRFRLATALSLPLLGLPLLACTTPESEDDGWRDGGKADDNAVTLDFKHYDVLFTNPLCRDYAYPTPIATADGSAMLTKKPSFGIMCSPSGRTVDVSRRCGTS